MPLFGYDSPIIGDTTRKLTKNARRNSIGNMTRKKSKRANSTSPNKIRKTKSTAQQLTEYKMKSDRSRSVTGRMPRVNMADDFARSLRANAVPPSKRTMKNYYYPKMPLDVQREVNDWVGPPSPLKDKKELHRDLKDFFHQTYWEEHDLNDYHNKDLFEQRMRKNIRNIQIKLFDMMYDFMKKNAHLEATIIKFVFLYFLKRTRIDPYQCYARDTNTVALFDSDHFQIMFDFRINRDYSTTSYVPVLFFTFVPKNDMKEFKKIPYEEKKKRGLYDGYIFQDATMLPEKREKLTSMCFPADKGIFLKHKLTVLDIGKFVHEYVQELDGEPQADWNEKYPNRPHNNDELNKLRRSNKILWTYTANFFT